MNVLITGLGSIARKHIEALHKALPGERHTITALRSGHGSSPAPEGVISVTDLSEADMARMDFAIISNPTSAHAATVAKLLPYRLPLMIEKPVFDTPAHAALIEQAQSQGTLTYVACNLRFLSCLRFLKEHIAGMRINEVNVYCGSHLPSWRPGTDWRKCYSAIPELGGGVHLDLIHELDYVCWLFGLPDDTRSTFRSHSSLGIAAVDYANYCLIYPGFCASVLLNYYRPDYRRTIEIVTDTDIITADLAANTVTDRHGNTLYSSDKGIADTYTDQMRYFTSLVKEGAMDSFNSMAYASEILKTTLPV